MSDPRWHAEGPVVAGLTLLTLLALPGTRGVLGSTRPLWPVALTGVTMHLVAWGCRRRLPVIGPLAALAAVPVVAAWVALPGTTAAGIPWTGTWRAATAAGRAGLDALGAGADVPANESIAVVEGRLLLVVLLVGLTAVLADQAAFRLRVAPLAVVPSFTLILLGATRAPVEEPAAALSLYLLATAVFVLVHRHVQRSSERLVAGSHHLRGVLPVGALMAGTAILAGSAIGPALPGYGDDAIVASSGSVLALRGQGARIDSLLDLGSTLSNASDRVMFRVMAPLASYWRLASLDQFDGQVWSKTKGPGLAEPPASGLTSATILRQDIQIEQLRSEWLPAAYRAVDAQRAVGVVGALRPDATATLVQETATHPGQRYTVVSSIQQVVARQLHIRARRSQALTPYLALPTDFPRRIQEEAASVTNSAGGDPYAAAVALQTYFRQRFTYDQSIGTGGGKDALARFLFETRRGFCVQFAGAYAAMARSVGLPARVTVGFTPGEVEDAGRFVVRGRHAHAWPEVYFEGAGWVAFEPTPGRGMPGAESYTGLTVSQATASTVDQFEVPVPQVATEPESPPPPTVLPVTGTVTPMTPSPDPAVSAGSSEELSGQEGALAPKRSWAFLDEMLRALAAVVATCVPLAAVVLAKLRRRRVRRKRATTSSDRVLVAWLEADEALAAAGMGRRPSETMLAHANRAAGDRRMPAELTELVVSLAGQAGAASYASQPAGGAVATRAVTTAAVIEATLRRAQPFPYRVVQTLDPRPLWRKAGP